MSSNTPPPITPNTNTDADFTPDDNHHPLYRKHNLFGLSNLAAIGIGIQYTNTLNWWLWQYYSCTFSFGIVYTQMIFWNTSTRLRSCPFCWNRVWHCPRWCSIMKHKAQKGGFWMGGWSRWWWSRKKAWSRKPFHTQFQYRRLQCSSRCPSVPELLDLH